MPDTTSVPPPAPTSEATTRKPAPTRKPRKKRHSGMGENTGRWTAEEHRLFLQGLEQHGKGWKKIASLIKSRTVVQIRTHAQKYFQKLAKARQNGDEGDITMDPARCLAAGGGGLLTSCSVTSHALIPRRRKPVTGTKRKALQSLVQQATADKKKQQRAPHRHHHPVLAHFYVPPSTSAKTDTPASTAGSALEDSLYVVCCCPRNVLPTMHL